MVKLMMVCLACVALAGCGKAETPLQPPSIDSVLGSVAGPQVNQDIAKQKQSQSASRPTKSDQPNVGVGFTN